MIPVYNHERYVEDALVSVLAQTSSPLEVIVIDDGSCDRSANVVRKLAERHPEIIFWSHQNQGAHHTINAGVYRAQGEFVAILNSDDLYHPDRLAECLEILDSCQQVSAVFTSIGFLDDVGTAIRNPWYEKARGFYQEVGDLSLGLISGNFIMTTSNLMIRRSVFRDVGLFSALRYAHDLDFFLRLYLREKCMHFLDKPLLSYRLHGRNTIREGALKVKAEWAAVVAFFLYCYSRKRRADGYDWSYYSKLTDITDQHGLTRLLVHFFAYFASLQPSELTVDAYTRDERFLQFLTAAVR